MNLCCWRSTHVYSNMLECHAIGKQWEICIKTNRSFPIQQKSWILLYGHEWSRAYRLHIPGSQSDNLWISYKYFTQETSACRIARSEVFVHFQFLGFFSIRKRAKKNRVLLRSLNSFNWDKLQNYRFLGNFGLTDCGGLEFRVQGVVRSHLLESFR